MQDVAKTAYDTVDLRFSTPAVQLTTGSDGSVTGVIARDADGYFQANASKGVILATGGYDANPEMMQAWTRVEDYAYSSWWNPAWGTTGDGHMMGLAIGAQMDPIPHPVMNFRWGTPDSFADFRTWAAISLGHSRQWPRQALRSRRRPIPGCLERPERPAWLRQELLVHLR